MSPEAWAFFSANSIALMTLIAQQLRLRRGQERVEHDASKAAESAIAAEANTTNVSNGFVGRMDRKLDRITDTVEDVRKTQRKTDQALREHLEWHLEREK